LITHIHHFHQIDPALSDGFGTITAQEGQIMGDVIQLRRTPTESKPPEISAKIIGF
jgi:hypothetical protein